MKRDPGVLLEDIERAAEKIASFAEGVGLRAYIGNIGKQRAVERNSEVIGEALNQLHQTDPELGGRITDSRDVAGFRNLLVHGHFSVKPDRVWTSAADELPAFRLTVHELMAELDSLEETAADECDESPFSFPGPLRPPSPFD